MKAFSLTPIATNSSPPFPIKPSCLIAVLNIFSQGGTIFQVTEKEHSRQQRIQYG